VGGDELGCNGLMVSTVHKKRVNPKSIGTLDLEVFLTAGFIDWQH